MAADMHGLQGVCRSQFLSWTWTWHDPLEIPGFSNVTKLFIVLVGSTEVCKAAPCQRRPPHQPAPDRPRGAPGSTCPALPQQQRSASALPSCGSSTSPSSSALLAARETPHQAEQGRRWVSTVPIAHESTFLTPLLCRKAEASHFMTLISHQMRAKQWHPVAGQGRRCSLASPVALLRCTCTLST